MRAAILAVGSELLGADRLDTNSLRLAEALEAHGVELALKLVVGDDEGRIAAALEQLLACADLILVTGGLGPTADDRTRPAVARALGRSLQRDPRVVEEIRARFARFGRVMPEVNARQGDVIDGAELLANPAGTAPGQRLIADGRTLFLFPGVPRELEGMIAGALVPWLAGRGEGQPAARRTLRVACLPESEVEERIAPLYERYGAEGIGLLPAPADIELRLTAVGPDREARLAAMVELARECLGVALYAESGAETLEAVVGRLLAARQETVATAESCTGGLVAERLTRVAGSSAYVVGGVVAYDNRLKEELLEVPAALLARHGAVSREVAEAMAAGCRRRLGSHWALAVTGIAGPGGGSADKPVGTVHLAVAGPDGGRHDERRLPGDRATIRRQASQWVLDLLRRELLT